eukprot:4293902-Ditylum_brightwellii.AAC.1
MSYLCNKPYPEAHEFSIEELERLMPHDIYRWMAWKACGTDDPSPDDNPTEGRSSSLKYPTIGYSGMRSPRLGTPQGLKM